MKTICVYCGSSPGRRSEYSNAARELATQLVNHDIGLVYGGASVGIMGEIADAVLAAGGKVIGVMPKALVEKEVQHDGLTELLVVDSMHSRKLKMADISDGFIAMPGGLGTLEELFEVLTWAQLGFHQKPCALFNVEGYYDKLAEFLRHAVDEKFVKAVHSEMLLIEQSAEHILEAMMAYQPPTEDKWIGRGDT